MHILLLLLFTILPVVLSCLAWDAKIYFNIIDWDGHKHVSWCRDGSDCDGSGNCPEAVDIRTRDPRLRVEFGMRFAVLALGLITMSLLWQRVAS